ncbi:centromere-associated protein E [Bombina bombina]|uniref:centromere-associated protein E n=1 Tax=Bombina bombina TaxID=8345 RepID=UPI00235A7720|nr:centromere-associated protein E [Bombina bombina]
MSEGDAVKVVVRVRPLIQREQGGDQVNLLWKAEKASISQVDGTKTFNFDRVFHSHETTTQVYQEIAVPIIRAALLGYNGTIFAYGQTSSGKTYTMMGTENSMGIIPLAVQEIFRIIQEIPGREFLLRVSYMEIYNETVTDLLCDDRKKKPLEIREDINRNVYVADLTEEVVVIPEHVLKWIKKGEKNRHYGETKMNEHSSRSHTIFRMIVESRERNDPGNAENCDGAVMVSHLNLVDLAGSERASQTGAEGVRLKEGCNINRSLFILGQVIKKLSDGQVGGFINYRDSKLTRILQNSLGGNAKTLIICTITPVSFDETLSTLQFASTAKHMRNTPHVNEVLDDQALLKRYRKEIMDLKKQLEDLEASSGTRAQVMAKEEYSQLLAEIQLLQKERENRIWNLTSIVVASSQTSKEDQRLKRKRRVTWAPGKLQNSLCNVDVSSFNVSSITASISKRTKLSDLPPLTENDDSCCTEFSDFGELTNVLEDFVPETELPYVNKSSRRENVTLSESTIEVASDGPTYGRAQSHDFNLQKYKEMEQKATELENQLKTLTKKTEIEAEKIESQRKEILSLQTQLQTKEEEKNELRKSFELKLKDFESPFQGEKNGIDKPLMENSKIAEHETQEENKDLFVLPDIMLDPSKNEKSQTVHDECEEQRKMLELKILDLEDIIKNLNSLQNDKERQKCNEQDFIESIQLCEVLMTEKANALEELAVVRNNFDSIILENETLKREISDLERQLEEKLETDNFEILEKETQKEHEAQLIHEITSLKMVVENKNVYIEELKAEFESNSKLLKVKEEQLDDLKKHAEDLQKKVRNMDLSISVGGSEKLCEEIFQIKQSFSDAENVTLDAKKESAFLRSENLQLKEKMMELSVRFEQMEKDLSIYEKQLESEKAKYKSMQTDLQKELQYAFSEINQLNGLMVGRVPQDLLSRVELDKKIVDYSKQLEKALEDKNNLEKEVHEVSEELGLLKAEREQSAIVMSSQEYKLQEQSKQIDKLTEDVAHYESQLLQTEEQHLELKKMHEELQEKCLFANKDISEKQNEAEQLTKEAEQLKGFVEMLEGKLSSKTQEAEDLQEQAAKLLQLQNEKEELEVAHQTLLHDMEELKGNFKGMQISLDNQQMEKQEFVQKLQELKNEMSELVMEKETLQQKMEDIEAERDSLKQDLNENIELSIETQEELRTAQEELKQQKQIVKDLKKQIEEYAESTSLETDYQGILQEKGTLQNKLQESETMCQKLEDELNELKRVNQNLITEIDCLHESLKTAQVTLENVEEEKHDVSQKRCHLEEQLRTVSHERDEVKNEIDKLKELEKTVRERPLENNLYVERNQLHDDVIVKQLEEKLLEALKEKDELQEIIGSLKEERNQLRFDLQENIEMSIETQDELRCALEELKKKPLLDNMNDQVQKDQTRILTELEYKIRQLEEQLDAIASERDNLVIELKTADQKHESTEAEECKSVCVEEDMNKIKDNLREGIMQADNEIKKTCLRCACLLDEEQVNKLNLQSEIEEKIKIIKEQESQLHEADTKYKTTIETMEMVTREKDQLLLTLNSLAETNEAIAKEYEAFRQERKTKDQLLQTSFEISMLNAEGEMKESLTRLEDAEIENYTNTEKLDQLHQQLVTISFEKEELQSVIENLKENAHLISEQLKDAEKEAKQNFENQFKNSQESLLREIEQLKEQLKITETKLELRANNAPFCEKESSLTESALVLNSETIEVGLYNFSNEKETEINQSNLSDMRLLEENLQSCQALMKVIQCEKLELEDKLKHLQEELMIVSRQKEDLQCKLVRLLETSEENTQENEGKLQSEDKEADGNSFEKLIQLQQQLHLASQERMQLQDSIDKLKKENDQLMLMIDHLKSSENETIDRLNEQCLGSQEALVKEIESKQEYSQQSCSSEIKLPEETLLTTETLLETIQNEKRELENQLRVLQEEVLNLKNELHQKTAEEQQITDKYEQVQHNLKLKVDELTETVTYAESALVALRMEKIDDEQKLTDLQQKMDIVLQERDELLNAKESLTAVSEQLKEALEHNISKETIDRLNEQCLSSQEALVKEIESEQEHSQQSCSSEIKLPEEALLTTEALMETIQNEKREIENQLHVLREEVLNLKNELHQKTAEEQQKTDKYEQVTHNLKLKVDELTETVTYAESALVALRMEKIDDEQKLTDLQQKMDIVIQERDELLNAKENLTAVSEQLKEALEHNISKETIDRLDDQRLSFQETLVKETEMQLEQTTCETSETVQNSQLEVTSVIAGAEQSPVKHLSKTEDLNEAPLDLCHAEIEQERSQQSCSSEIKLLEETLQTTEALMETIQNEKRELENQLHVLREEVLNLKNELHQKTAEEQQITDKYEQVQHNLKLKVDELTETVTYAETALVALRMEKIDDEQKLTDLQQKMDIVIQERDELLNAKESLTAVSEQLKEALEHNISKETIDRLDDQCLSFQETLVKETEMQLEQTTCETSETVQNSQLEVTSVIAGAEQSPVKHLSKTEDLNEAPLDLCHAKIEQERSQQSCSSEIKLLEETLQTTEALMETIQNEKRELENQLHVLREEVLNLKNELHQKTAEEQQITDKYEQVQHNLKLKVDELTETVTYAESALLALRMEKIDDEQKLTDLQQKMDIVIQERDELLNAKESLTAVSDQLKEALEHNISKCTEAQDQLGRAQDELKCQRELFDDLQSQVSSRPTKELVQTLEEKILQLEKTLNQKTAEEQQLIDVHEQAQHKINLKVEQLTETMKYAESELESLQAEKLNAEEKVLNIQQQMEMVSHERDELLITKNTLVEEIEKMKNDLQDHISMCTEAQDQLGRAQDELKCQRELFDDLQSQVSSRPTKELVQTLEEKILQLEKTLNQKTAEEQQLIDVHEQAQHKINLKVEQLTETMKYAESELESLQAEKLNAEEKVLNIQQQMEMVSHERDELLITKNTLVEEIEKMKNDLQDHISMFAETQEELRKTQDDLKSQKKLTDDLRIQVFSNSTDIVQSLEKQVLSLKKELQQKTVEAQELIDDHKQAQHTLRLKVEQLMVTINHFESELEALQVEKSAAQEELFFIQQQMDTVNQEKTELKNIHEKLIAESNQLKDDLKENVSMSIEIQDELRRVQEELQHQKHKELELNTKASILEQKISSGEEEMANIVTKLEEAISEREAIAQSKEQLASQLELMNQSLISKDAAFELLDKEKMEVASKLQDVEQSMKALSEERDQLLQLNVTLQEETKKLNEYLQQLQHQHDDLCVEREALVTENKQLKERIDNIDAATQQLKSEKDVLEKQIKECDMEISSFHQEKDQFQQLLDRIRNEKDSIYSALQDQEKTCKELRGELQKCQDELKSNNALNQHTKKAENLDDVLQQLSSLQQQLEQQKQKLTAERFKNHELCENVNLLEKKIEVMHSIMDEPDEPEQQDELVERTELLETKNQELKNMIGKVSEMYSEHHNLLNHITRDLQFHVDSEKQSLSAIKESLSSTMSKAFGNLQTEYLKLNSQLQAILNKFKIGCRDSALGEDDYSLIKEYEKDLCAEQKKLDEMECIEEHGTKFSDAALKDLKHFETEYINQLILKKITLVKRIEGDFSEVQVNLNSLESLLQEEVNCKKEFLVWLEGYKSLEVDALKLNEGVKNEYKRIATVIKLLTKKIKVVAAYKTNSELRSYINKLDSELQEIKRKNQEKMDKMKLRFPNGSSDVLEEENAALIARLKTLEAELKKTQSRIEKLEQELDCAKRTISQKEKNVELLQSQLLSRTAESELANMQVKLTEKENNLKAAFKEIQSLRDKVAQGALPYREEIDHLKTQLVKIEMERMKLSKSTDQEMSSLKACLDDREDRLRKLKEQLRRTQQDHDSTFVRNDHTTTSNVPLTCGGGSGIVQSTAMLVLQSEKATLERELAQYRKKCDRLSRNMSHLEDEFKKSKEKVTRPETIVGSVCKPPRSPCKIERHTIHGISPSKTETHRKHLRSPRKTESEMCYPASPVKTESQRKRQTLFSDLTVSPNKRKNLQECLESPKSKFFDSKSMPPPLYNPSQFFDNSCLGVFSDQKPVASTETNEYEWWNDPNREVAPECKTS